MSLEIRVPMLGESLVEATIGKWTKQVGDKVSPGEIIVELETDKVNIEVPAEQGGVLSQITSKQGDIVKVGDLIGVIADSVSEPAAAATAASPVAKRLAQEKGLDLAKVKGTGPNGRVTKEDVSAHIEQAPPVPAPAAPQPQPEAPAAPPPVSFNGLSGGARPEERIPMSRRRITIAQRLVEAQHTAAMLTTFNEVDMSEVMDIRKRRKDSFKERNGVGLGFMSFFTKASIGALKAFPLANAEIQNDEIVIKKYYDIGVAVSTEQGLVVPVVRDADRKTFAQVEKDIADLAGRARDNKLSLPELLGGTFTITNGGVFGSLMSTPILNTPQVAILGMHKIQERPVVVGGEIVIRPMMYLALSYDHRILDGSEAVRFLVRIKELLEDPESLMLEA